MASKIGERIYVEAFLDCLSESHVIVAERESPDFLIAMDDEQFGLEVAQVFRDQAAVGDAGSPAKARESKRSKVLQQLSTNYYAVGGLPLYVQALFSNPAALKHHSLVQRIKDACPSAPWERATIECDGAILHLRALPVEAGQYNRWVCVNNSVGWRGQIELTDILPVIQDKASRLPAYRSAVPRVELLLVVDGTRRSGMVRWDVDQVQPSLYGFDAIYLYFHPDGVLHRWYGAAVSPVIHAQAIGLTTIV